MRFLADMNISPLTVAALAAEGMDIVRVSSLLPLVFRAYLMSDYPSACSGITCTIRHCL